MPSPYRILTPLASFVIILLASSASAQTGKGGFIKRTLEHDGYTREYNLYVPSAYDGSQAWPLVLSYHGFSWNIALTGDRSQPWLDNLKAVADTADFLIAYPLGLNVTLGLPQGERTNTGWNADGSFGAWDDVDFTSLLIDDVYDNYKIDLSRVYATGMSSGGEMAFALACRLSDRIASISGVNGPLMEAFFDGECPADRPVSILQMHGTNDSWFPYTGYIYDDFAPRPVTETAAFWAAHNGCQVDSLVTELPDIDNSDNSTVTLIQYPGCRENTEVLHYRINGGGHTWSGRQGTIPELGTINMDIDATSLIWDFFRRHPHPDPRPAFEGWNTRMVGHWAPDSADAESIEDVIVGDDIALVCSNLGYGNGTVWLVDATDPMNPTGSVLFEHGCGLGALNGTVAYYLWDHTIMHIYDVSKPDEPIELGQFFRGPDPADFTVEDTLAFFVYEGRGLQIVDVSDPTVPVEIGFLEVPAGGPIAVDGNHAYMPSSTDDGLYIVDISDPENPTEIKFNTGWGNCDHGSLVAEENLLFSVCDWDGRILDVSDPVNTETISDFNAAWFHEIDVSGNFVYLGLNGGLEVLDVSDPTRPRFVGGYGGEINAVAATDEYIYLVGSRHDEQTGEEYGRGLHIIALDKVAVAIEDEPRPELPTAVLLHQNYPNPFNPTTTITYDLSESADVRLTVFDGLGRTVETFSTRYLVPGTYSVTLDATRLPSGVYFYRLQASNYTETKSLILAK